MRRRRNGQVPAEVAELLALARRALDDGRAWEVAKLWAPDNETQRIHIHHQHLVDRAYLVSSALAAEMPTISSVAGAAAWLAARLEERDQREQLAGDSVWSPRP